MAAMAALLGRNRLANRSFLASIASLALFGPGSGPAGGRRFSPTSQAAGTDHWGIYAPLVEVAAAVDFRNDGDRGHYGAAPLQLALALPVAFTDPRLASARRGLSSTASITTRTPAPVAIDPAAHRARHERRQVCAAAGLRETSAPGWRRQLYQSRRGNRDY
jgi:hypothetical protein